MWGRVAVLVCLIVDDAAARPCARVVGDPAIVDAVVPLLVERRVSVAECPELVATVAGEGARVRVVIVDAEGRRVERVAEDARGAATAIESWARADIAAPLLEAREPVDDEVPPVVARVEPAPPPATRSIELAAAVDLGVGGDGAIWRAARLQGCVRLGSICVGTLVRYAVDTERTGDSAALATSRSLLELFLTADLPVALGRGRVAIVPGVGVGQMSVWAERSVPDEREDEATGPALRAAVAGSVRIAGGWSLRAEVAAHVAPFASARLGELAGAPEVQAWFGLGLAWGGL